MTEKARTATVLLVGVMLIQLTISGTYARYVRVETSWILLSSGAALIGLGLAGVIRMSIVRRRSRPAGHSDHSHRDHESGHAHGTGVAWLLVAAVAAVLISPPALGSYGLDRNSTATAAVPGQTFAPLPSDRTAEMSVLEYTQRAAVNNGASLGSTPVSLTGFVAKTDGTGFWIARYKIACCAADAAPAIVRVTGANGAPPAVDQWITITGTFQPPTDSGSTDSPPELVASEVAEITAPDDPYE